MAYPSLSSGWLVLINAEDKEEGYIKSDAQLRDGFTPTGFQEWAYGGEKTFSLGSIELEAWGHSSWRKYGIGCHLWAWNCF